MVGAYSCPEPCGNYSHDPEACNARSACWSTGFCTGWGSCGGITNQGQCEQMACTWNPSCIKRFNWECYRRGVG